MKTIAEIFAKTVRLAQGNAATMKPASKEGEARTFQMLAYTGDAVSVWGTRLVFELSGIEVPGQAMPILLGHNTSKIAGQSAKISIDKKDGVTIEGTLSRVTKTGKKVAMLADDGFPWQASAGLDALGKIERIGDDETVKLNGRSFDGPLYVIRKSVLRESSFVPLGADGATKSIVLSADELEEYEMPDPKEGDEKIIKLTERLTISEFKMGAPKLYELCREEILREDKGRRAEIKSAIVKTELPAAVQGRLSLACSELPLSDALKTIEREERVEVALSAAKTAGLDEKDLDALRKDIADVPMGSAVRMVQLTVDAKKGAAKRLVDTADPAVTQPAANAKVAERVKLARADFASVKKNFPTLKELDYVEQALDEAKLTYTPDELKAAAPDLFK